MAQVRIDPELAKQLLTEGDGRSLRAEVDRRLRASLRLPAEPRPVQQPTEARGIAVAAPSQPRTRGHWPA